MCVRNSSESRARGLCVCMCLFCVHLHIPHKHTHTGGADVFAPSAPIEASTTREDSYHNKSNFPIKFLIKTRLCWRHPTDGSARRHRRCVVVSRERAHRIPHIPTALPHIYTRTRSDQPHLFEYICPFEWAAFKWSRRRRRRCPNDTCATLAFCRGHY